MSSAAAASGVRRFCGASIKRSGVADDIFNQGKLWPGDPLASRLTFSALAWAKMDRFLRMAMNVFQGVAFRHLRSTRLANAAVQRK